MLTIEQFNALPHGEVFRVIIMKSNAATMERDEEGQLVPVDTMFVCKKGAVNDWAIYYSILGVLNEYPVNAAIEGIKDYGFKLIKKEYIRSVVEVDSEVLNLYRL